jgi:hypothetical protein
MEYRIRLILGPNGNAHAESCGFLNGSSWTLVDHYLQASIGATKTHDRLDASAAVGRCQGSPIAQFSPALPSIGQVTIDEFNNSFTASISANDGQSDSIQNEDVYLPQFGVTYYATTSAYNAFTNGAPMAYLFEN